MPSWSRGLQVICPKACESWHAHKWTVLKIISEDSMTCQYICQTSRYCFYFSYNENMGHCYIKFSGAGTVDPINHGEGSGWYSGYYNCGGNQT